jgi:hypothetical protein
MRLWKSLTGKKVQAEERPEEALYGIDRLIAAEDFDELRRLVSPRRGGVSRCRAFSRCPNGEGPRCGALD